MTVNAPSSRQFGQERDIEDLEFASDYCAIAPPTRHLCATSANPKHIRAQKDGKAPMEYLVWSVLEGDALVHKGGADKYGLRNWLIDKILATTYAGAMMRHLKAWAEGEDVDPESGYSHLYHLRACCAILLDSEKHGTLIDDRGRVDSINERSE